MRHRSIQYHHQQKQQKRMKEQYDSSTSARNPPDDADVAAGVINVQLSATNRSISNGHHSHHHSHSNPQTQIHARPTIVPFGSETDSSLQTSSDDQGVEKEHLYQFQHHQEIAYSTSTNHNNHKEQVLVLGVNITHLSRKSQFIACALGVFSFSLLYGYLQELISVTLCNRQLGLFLAMMQFLGYTMWSKIFHLLVQTKKHGKSRKEKDEDYMVIPTTENGILSPSSKVGGKNVPIKLYIFLSVLRAIDAAMTNMAMAYVNYPAKTLMKSSRVVFTMLFGAIIRRKKYKPIDYLVVLLMVSGLVIFMHADANSSAIFQPIGIMMLLTSLLCDGAINNMSEAIMTQYNVGQDEFIYNLYSIAVIGIIGAAMLRGDFKDGFNYILTPGTLEEIQSNSEIRSWSVTSKCIVIFLFSSTGFFGSSCSALITKEFGALTMSITSTARKAMTLFISFFMFKNVCTLEHVSGIFLFITALVAKSFRASRGSGENKTNGKGHNDNDQDQILNKGHSSQHNDMGMGDSHKEDNGVKRRIRRGRDHEVDIV
jgi:adenosine 3'-phospho 5'-phosphosulfate transporter B3